MRGRSSAALSGKPLAAVFGTGTPAFQRAMNGAPYDSPLKATREYVTTVSRLLKGTSGEARRADATATTRLDPTLTDFPEVETGLGVLQGKMARPAVEQADVALTWMTPLSYVRDTLLLGARCSVLGARWRGAGPPCGQRRPRRRTAVRP